MRSRQVRRSGAVSALFIAAALLLPVRPAAGAGDNELDISRLTLEELMDIEVTTTRRPKDTVGTSPAAVFVITQEMIRRSGATSIPEALRMAPGMEVARGVENGGWLLGVRGFNSIPSTKLLVLMDGRSVYNPLSAGVFWDVQDTLLEDIERIEVIRGPGGALWGSNAVNGIVNVITKNAKSTRGLLVTGGGGTYERAFGGARYGWALGKDAHARVYAKHYTRGELLLPGGAGAGDPWWMSQAGFRSDWRAGADDRFTLQGDLYGGTRRNPGHMDLSGGNALARWTRGSDDGGEWRLQAYYDRTDRTIPGLFDGIINTVDADFQHSFRWGGRQAVVWGLGCRRITDRVAVTPVLPAPPKHKRTGLYSAFVQDEIELLAERLRLTVGSKFEHNEFTGLEAQPSGRLSWTISPRHNAWAAVSRAVRTPTMQEDDSTLRRGPVNTYGSSGFESEEVTAYEAGYRAIAAGRLTLDIAAFHNKYDRLASLERLSSTTVLRDNKLAGETRGAELSATWMPADRFSLQAAYSLLNISLRAKGGSVDTTSAASEGNDPRRQGYARASLNLSSGVQLDATVRWVERLPNLGVPGYAAADLRAAWRPSERFEVAIVGQNIFDKRHLEYAAALRKEIPRGVYAKASYLW